MRRSYGLLWMALCVPAFAGGPLFAQIPSWPVGKLQSQDLGFFSQQTPAAAQEPDPPSPKTTDGHKNSLPDSPQPNVESHEDQQTKRILWIIPNYRAVSANTQLPPLAFKDKFWLATQDSFDYSAFIWVGLVAGVADATKSEPSFGHGASAYGIYYAHNFADNAIENYFVEAIMPTVAKQDPRYYTLGHGGFFKRSAYAISRLAITRTDSGNETVNISEIVGAGAGAGLSNAYYPDRNMWVKTYQRWASQLIQDGISNVAKEFWPDINHYLFHNKY